MSDVLIIGAGPAGCSCALWLAQQGIESIILEETSTPMNTLRELNLTQDWVLGHPNTSTAKLADLYTQHIKTEKLISILSDVHVEQVEHLSSNRKIFKLSNGTRLETRALVIATGLRTKRLASCDALNSPMDAVQLTKYRNTLRSQRILLIGGGDNAVENALFLANQNNAVVLWARSELRAQPHFQSQLKNNRDIYKRIGIAMPNKIEKLNDGTWQVTSDIFGKEIFDDVAALIGFEPNEVFWSQLQSSSAWASVGWPHWPLQKHDLSAAHGLFFAGDISQRLHPSVQTALADGVTASKQICRWLQSHGPQLVAPPLSEASCMPSVGVAHVLNITGLRFHANLGILAHEKNAPQPIQVDAELSLGAQPLRPHDDDIEHVLDYRKVRQIIIDECTAEHVNLLESLIGKLAQRLMLLPGVRGVRVKIAKLEIFDDCEVAIRMETGQW